MIDVRQYNTHTDDQPALQRPNILAKKIGAFFNVTADVEPVNLFCILLLLLRSTVDVLLFFSDFYVRSQDKKLFAPTFAIKLIYVWKVAAGG